MTIILPRRGFLISAASALGVLAAPPLVRASSLDAVLRGYNLDPKVLAFYRPEDREGEGRWVASWLPMAAETMAAHGRIYSLVRLSQTDNEGDFMRVESQQLPYRVHLEKLKRLQETGINGTKVIMP